MNTEMTISSTKGKEEITLTLWPSSNLESALFKDLFSNPESVEMHSVPNSETIIIKKKLNATALPIKSQEQPGGSGLESATDKNSPFSD